MGHNISLTPVMLGGGEVENDLEEHEVEAESNLDVDGKAELLSNLEGEEDEVGRYPERILNGEDGQGESFLEAEEELGVNVKCQEIADESTEDFQTHPLMLPPVLAKVFSNLSPKQLANCRRVCSLWYQESLSTWRSNSTVSLVNDAFDVAEIFNKLSQQPLFADDFGKIGSADDLPEFFNFWEDEANQCISKPFRQFHLRNRTFGISPDPSPSPSYTAWRIYHKCVEDDPLQLQRFWQQVGVHITTLSLQRCSFMGIGDARKVMYLACPNLQQLTLDSCKVLPESSIGNRFSIPDDHYVYQYISNEAATYEEPAFGEHIHLKALTLRRCLPDSWLQLLSHFSSLTTLNIYGDIMDPYHTPRLLEAVNIIRGRDNLKLPLEHVAPLNLDYKNAQASRNSFQLLEQFGFPLGQIQASLLNHVDHVFIKPILRLHASTLHRVVLDIRTPFKFLFPPGVDFENVEKLELRHGLCRNFHFLNSMTNLKNLVISYGEVTSQIDAVFESTLAPEMAGLQLAKLEELQIGYKMAEGNLRRMVGWIPNLLKLKMPLDDEQLGIVCQNWTNLVQLRDISDEITDDGLTRTIPNLGGVDGDEQPVIGQLQRLKHFRTLSQNLTVLSVRNGFLKMQDLQTVKIPLEADIGIDGEQALAANGVRILYRDEEDLDSDVDLGELLDRFNDLEFSGSDSD